MQTPAAVATKQPARKGSLMALWERWESIIDPKPTSPTQAIGSSLSSAPSPQSSAQLTGGRPSDSSVLAAPTGVRLGRSNVQPDERVCPRCGNPVGTESVCHSCAVDLTVHPAMRNRAEWEASLRPKTDEEWDEAWANLNAVQARWNWDEADLDAATLALVPFVVALDFSALSRAEITAVRQFLAGVPAYDPSTRDTIADGMAANVKRKVPDLPQDLLPALTLLAVAVFVPEPGERSASGGLDVGPGSHSEVPLGTAHPASGAVGSRTGSPSAEDELRRHYTETIEGIRQVSSMLAATDPTTLTDQERAQMDELLAALDRQSEFLPSDAPVTTSAHDLAEQIRRKRADSEG